MKRLKVTMLLTFSGLLFFSANSAELFVEAESFATKGGWVVDQQFAEQMGSPYLMAHGMGIPVHDATTKVVFPKTGTYRLFVRTYNWTAPWHTGDGPGRFQLLLDGIPVSTFGEKGDAWNWQDGGLVNISDRNVTLTLHDLTGFNGRCDAIYFTQTESFAPPANGDQLTAFRYAQTKIKPSNGGKYDLVVVGGGVAGMCAAISAARSGLKVAIIHDRPVWGGNNSSEVRVHLGGRMNLEPYPQLGGVVNELSPANGGNAKPAANYEDDRKLALMNSEPNISKFLKYRAFAVTMNGRKIKSITAKNIVTGAELVFTAPVFADCTGDGTVGVLAGADWTTGREAKSTYGEAGAPAVADKMTMGSSVQWYSADLQHHTDFPRFKYGLEFSDASVQKVTMGEWTWETGMNLNQVTDFERIRDYGLLVVFSNWSFLKNEYRNKAQYATRTLDWVAYVAGKRESRRLLGDYVLRQQDITDHIVYPDGTASTSWSIDLHYPDPKNTQYFPGQEFISICTQEPITPYPVPYRCLYSRNVDNLFMAGRNISVSHIALGTVRVMRTTGMLGEVVGMAAALCKQNKTSPRGVYEQHLDELKALMKKGVGRKDITQYPKYNGG